MIEDARMAISRVTGIPGHYLGMAQGGWPSGESLKTANERLTRKVLDRQEVFGGFWADVMRFCLEIKGINDVECEVQWADPTPRLSEMESWNAAKAEQDAGGSVEKTLRERGYNDKEIDEAKQDALDRAFGDGFPRNANDDQVAAA
jgi:hypothetical protein